MAKIFYEDYTVWILSVEKIHDIKVHIRKIFFILHVLWYFNKRAKCFMGVNGNLGTIEKKRE